MSPERHLVMIKNAPHIPYPVRINRYLALTGVSTRRAADDLIRAGKVRINGRMAVLTDRVNEGDDVTVSGPRKRNYRYFAFHKPRGVLTNPERGHAAKAISDVAGIPGVFPVGRLDRMSEGLIILTDDGRVTERLLSPRYDHEKEYVVTIRERIRPDMIHDLEKGPVLEDGPTKPCTVRKISDTTLSITLTEGRKHQVRRMLDAVGGTVTSLRRVRIMGIPLGALSVGRHRKLAGDELTRFLSGIGLQ